MRIAFLVGEFPALSETFILNQLTGLIDLGHQVDLYAVRRRTDPKLHPDVTRYKLMERVRYMNMPGRIGEYAVRAVPRFVRNLASDPLNALRTVDVLGYGRFAATLRLLYAASPFLGRMPLEYDVVHCHFGPHGVYGLKLRQFGAFCGKLVTSFHGFDVSSYVRERRHNPYDELFRKGDLFTVNSNHTYERLVALGCPQDRLIRHNMGVSLTRFPYHERGLPLARPVRLLTVARLVEVKGHEYAIHAVAELVRNRPAHSIIYDIVGDGPERPRLEALVRKFSLERSIRFHGAVDEKEVAAHYRDADIFILPSVTASDGQVEGAGVVLAEAQATGLPVIATRNGGIPSMVRAGVSARLVPERDAGALALALADLLDHPEVWPQMGREGRAFVAEHFDLERLNRQLVEHYERVSAGEPGK